MAEDPDMSFDIDALFDHLINNLDHDINDEKDWSFTLRSDDLRVLEKVASELETEFMVQLQETVEEVDIDGNSSFGPPLLSIVQRSALAADDVKAIADRIRSIAIERGLVYEGVTCYEPIDDEELFGWLAPEDAGWRLRHMTDCGLEENADLPWAFLIVTSSLDSIKRIGDELTSSGFNDRDVYDESDEDGNFGMCVFVPGRNNELELAATSTKIADVADRNGGRLEGIQFYTREDVSEVFGGDDEEAA